MRKPFFSILILSALLLVGACTKDDDETSPEIVATHLFGQLWLNSYEAKPDETPIYRPQGYTWEQPPVRYGVPFEGGDGFRFEKDGTLTYQAPGIGPGPTLHAGSWWHDTPDTTLFQVHLIDNYRPDFEVKIVSVGNDILRAQYLPSKLFSATSP